MKRKSLNTRSFLAIIFLLFATYTYAQSLSYSGTNSFNITQPTHLDAVNIPSLERTPTGIVFGDNGNKFYIVGTAGDIVTQFALSTPYDFSTRGTIEAYFRVNGEETNPFDIIFNDTGTRMYIAGGTGDDITQYTLSTAWDVSTAGSPVTFNAEAAIDTYLSPTTSHGDELTGIRFNNDGSKLFIVDRSADRVFEFSLTSNYDITTAGTVDADINLSGIESNPRGIEFNNDGTELYVNGNQGDDINTFVLDTAYDLTSLSSNSNSISLSTDEGTPRSILLNDDGTTFYIAGSANDQLYEYSLSTAYDFSSTITLINTFPAVIAEISPQGMVFNDDGSKLFVAGDQLNIISEIALSVPYDITTSTFTTALYVNNEQTQVRGLAFNNTGTTLYVLGNQNDEINGYDLSVAYDLSSTITTTSGSPFGIGAEDTNPSDIFFNNDGTKLYILGNDGNDLNQYSLSPAYDIADATAANLDIAFPLNNVSGLVIDSAPLGMAFNDDGTKLFIAGNQGNDINEITLSNAFDLSGGTITNTNTYNVNSEESTITDVIFNADGSKFFICGTSGDDMNQYQTRGNLPETSANNGTIDVSTPLVVTITGDTFADADADNLLDLTSEFTIANLPPGLTPIFTLSNGDTVATLTFSGTATSHLDSDEAAANMSFTFTDAAFSSSNAADVALAVGHTNVMGFDFIECSQDIVYNGSWSGGSGPGGAPDETDDASGISIQSDVTITSNFDCACLNVASGITLSTATGVQATVIGSLELIGDLRLLGTSQLLQTHTGVKNASGTGNLYKDRTGTLNNVFQIGYWGSPVTTNGSTYTISGVLKDGTTALTTSNTPPDITFTDGFDGDDTTSPVTLSRRWLAKLVDASTWSTFLSETSELFNPGEGFNKKSTGATSGQNYTFVGRPNDGDYDLTIGAVGSGRWSLLSNPYPSPINADTFIFDNATTASSIEGTLYFYEAGNDTSHISSEYTGGYATRTSGMGSPAAELGMSGKTPGQNIAIGQGFFVTASSTGGTISFNNAQRVLDPSDTNTENFGRSILTENFPILRLGFEFDLDGATYHRQLVTGFKGLTNDYDNGHEAAMWDYKSTDLALKVNNSVSPFVITSIEHFDLSLEIPLKLRTNQTRALSFMIDKLENLTTNIYIKDFVTDTYYDITNAKQEITVDAGTYDDRFFVVFSDRTLNTDNPTLENQIKFITKDQSLEIKTDQLEMKSITIYSILGKQVYQLDNVENPFEVTIEYGKVKTGLYIVNIETDQGIITKKTILN